MPKILSKRYCSVESYFARNFPNEINGEILNKTLIVNVVEQILQNHGGTRRYTHCKTVLKIISKRVR